MDFTLRDEGTIYLLTPQTPAAKAWLTENITGDEHQYFGESLVVEHRYILSIVEGIRDNGLTVGR